MINDSILIVDDKEEVLRSLKIMLQGSTQYPISTLSDPLEVLDFIQEHSPDLVLLDLNMPTLSGQDLLKEISESYPEVFVIIITATNELSRAVECVKEGAYDYFVKPVDHERLVNTIHKALEAKRMSEELSSIQKHLSNKTKRHNAFKSILTTNKLMLNLFRYMEAISKSNRQVLILGESGTGKELFAKAIHAISESRDNPMISVNISGLDDSTFSDSLFGHKKGAFTGAVQNRDGMVKKAEGGTLFLDEIGDLEMTSQVKLLRLLQERSYYPLGSDTPEYCDVKIIAATHHDLESLINKGLFRRDLFFRLQMHTIMIPPLRDRKEDIPLLVKFFVKKTCKEFDCPIPQIPDKLFSLLGNHPFMGNVRELEILIFDAIAQAASFDEIDMEHIKSKIILNLRVADIETKSEDSRAAKTDYPTIDDPTIDYPTIEDSTKQLIHDVLNQTGNNNTQAAKILGISRQALYKRIKREKDQEQT